MGCQGIRTIIAVITTSAITSEQAAGRYSRAFLPEELLKAIGPFRTSPLGLAPKPHTDTFRLIEDLSYPRGNPLLPSVNAGIDADQFSTAWGTFDEAVKLILHLPPESLAATFDISAAYRLTPIRPDQQHAVCIMWEGKVYVDRAVMFGLASSAGVFGADADMLIAIYRKAGFTPIIKWVDDFLVIRLPGQTWSEEDFMDLTARAGVPWSQKKVAPLCICATLHRLRLGLKEQDSLLASRKSGNHYKPARDLGAAWGHLFRTRSCKPAWQTYSLFLHFPTNSSFPPLHLLFRPFLPFEPRQFTPTAECASRYLLDTVPPALASTLASPGITIPCRPRLVGRRKHLFWHWCRTGKILGGRQVGTGFYSRTWTHLHHRLGRSCCGRAGTPISPPALHASHPGPPFGQVDITVMCSASNLTCSPIPIRPTPPALARAQG